MKIFNDLKFIDLFAGIGGFRIALEEFGAKCVFSSEFDKFAQITYKANFGELPSGDITLIDEADIPKHDILCGGFPCQAFSISGKQLGFQDSRGTLFHDIIRILKYHMPKIVILENVANLKGHDDGKTLCYMKSLLEQIGYDVYHEVLNASNYGVPQSRKRVYFVCFIKELKIDDFIFPKPTNENIVLEDILSNYDEDNKYIIDRKDIILDKKINFERCNKPLRIGTINKGGQGERIYSTKGHAITLSAYGGGVAGKTGAYLVNGMIRKLSPEECKKVQGFPDNFKIPVSDSQAWKQFGNSVAIPVLKSILKVIVNNKKLFIKNITKEI